MKALEGVLATLSPKWALKRELYRARLERLYEAAKPSHSRKPVIGGGLSADAVLQGANTKLRAWARYLDENHDLAGGVLDCLVTNIVGSGIALEPRPLRADESTDEQFAATLALQWKLWMPRVDVTGEHSWAEALRLDCRSWCRDGEMFLHHVTNPRYPYPVGAVPYRLELLESDMVPLDLHGQEGKVNIIHGIGRDTWGRPLFFETLKQHPGAVEGRVSLLAETRRLPAATMEHLRVCKRIGQTRGVSVFANVILRLDDIRDYEESERIAARVAASMTAYIKRSPDFAEQYDTSADGVARRDFAIDAGMVFDGLLPGEEVGTIGTDRPNTSLYDFRKSQLKAVAAGTRTSASTISRDYDGSYSSQRQELTESSESYKTLRNYFVSKACQPAYENWVRAAVLGGVIDLPRGMTIEGATNAEWRAPQIPWIDPLKETQAEALAVEKGFTSRTAVIRRRGEDPKVIQSEIDADTFAPATAPVTDDEESEDVETENRRALR